MLNADPLQLRTISETDIPFLNRLYASTRAEEMALVPWSEDEKSTFLDQQFQAQHLFYQQQFPRAKFDLVLTDNEPIGRLYVDSREDEIRLIDIALMPEYRGNGIGGKLMNQVLEQAKGESKPVRIHVEHNNPAMRLYLRLGFEQIDTNGVYHLMEWKNGE